MVEGKIDLVLTFHIKDVFGYLNNSDPEKTQYDVHEKSCASVQFSHRHSPTDCGFYRA